MRLEARTAGSYSWPGKKVRNGLMRSSRAGGGWPSATACVHGEWMKARYS